LKLVWIEVDAVCCDVVSGHRKKQDLGPGRELAPKPHVMLWNAM
jgi:hypothetical protein